MFAFYDLETTGTNPAFDQPLQFAAILTDDDFNEIERIDIRCRLAGHILPAPWALAVTGISPETLTDPSLPSWYEFTQQIADIIQGWAPATWCGYNTIAFDEEFLRQSFYQNLQPNFYLTQYDNNDRLDIMKVVYTVHVLAPDILKWPIGDNGKISFKLDKLAPANGFGQHDAHDALGDVKATIHLANLIKTRAPNVWEQCLRNRNKHDVIELLQSGQPLQMIERFGGGPPKSYVGAYAGRNPDNPNAVGFLDLELADPDTLNNADDSILADAVSASPKIIRTVTVNKVPSLFEIDAVPQEIVVRAGTLHGLTNLHNRVGQALAGRYGDREEPDHVEQRIYSGFYSYDDKRWLEQFQKMDWPERYELVIQFQDQRLRQLGQRLVYLNAPELIDPDRRVTMKNAINDRWNDSDSKVPWTTMNKVTVQLDEVIQSGTFSTNILDSINDYYARLQDAGRTE